ncbi:hypothetical protein SAMN05444392_10130 [Seinonella peptonophila]|uniref:Uncharacterized protein n=1 Tax=Seinonella peptonophila TaxID=112248 RepID=A0A1M4SLG0_9BACL|nr:DUF6223 family protein [Seinonella peptonophila]SHE32992.1 hypothetical protein SAMN05444392_10130 [Seinonella peptonophila]
MKAKLISLAILSVLLLVPTFSFAAMTTESVVYGFTSGRLWASIDAFVGLFSAILAGLSMVRSKRQIGNGGRNGAIIAVIVGVIVIAYAGLHLTMFTGNFGTGSGKAGAIIAILMGLISIVLAGITLIRSRRNDLPKQK